MSPLVEQIYIYDALHYNHVDLEEFTTQEYIVGIL